MVAGQNGGTGSLLVTSTGAINANGLGGYGGGSIYFSANNGVTVPGAISTIGGTTGGSGGSIQIYSYNSGGITFSSNLNLNTSGLSGSGSSVTLNANSGTITVPSASANGIIAVNGGGNNGYGGSVQFCPAFRLVISIWALMPAPGEAGAAYVQITTTVRRTAMPL